MQQINQIESNSTNSKNDNFQNCILSQMLRNLKNENMLIQLINVNIIQYIYMKVTKIQFNSYIQSSPPKPQQKKSKNISSKRLIYQLKKNNKLSNNPLYLLNKTAVVSKANTQQIHKIRQYNQDYDISLKSNLLRPSSQKVSQIEGEKQKFDDPEASQLQFSKNKSLEQYKKLLRSQHRKSRSNYHQNRYQNAGPINPYTKQQYLYFRRSKKLVSPQNHMKIRKIKQMYTTQLIIGLNHALQVGQNYYREYLFQKLKLITFFVQDLHINIGRLKTWMRIRSFVQQKKKIIYSLGDQTIMNKIICEYTIFCNSFTKKVPKLLVKLAINEKYINCFFSSCEQLLIPIKIIIALFVVQFIQKLIYPKKNHYDIQSIYIIRHVSQIDFFRVNRNMISQSRLLIKQSYSFAKLIQLLPSGQLKVCSQGQKILSNALIGQLIIISIEGEPTSLFHNFINKESELHPDPNMANSMNSQVWISTLPYEHPNEKKNIYFLQTILKKKQDARKLHIVCSLISSVILLNLYQNSNIDFLVALKGKVILSKQKEMLSIRDCIGSILVMFRDDKNHQQMNSKANQFNQMINAQNIYSYVQNAYYFMDAYGFTRDEKIELEHYKMLKQILYSLQQNIRKKIVDGLMFGPILKQYITKIVRQFNQKGIIQLESITTNIEIDEGYDIFNQVYRQYHKNIKNIIGNNQNKPRRNLEEELEISKTDAIQAYNSKCSDQFYRFKLNEALNKNERQILSINNQLFRSSNLQFLERQSSKLLTGIQQNNYNNKKIKSEIQEIVNRYEQQAGGDSKYELLSQFLSKFVPQLMKNTQDTGKGQQVLKKMELMKKQNKQLQKKLIQWKKIQNKSSGCC